MENDVKKVYGIIYKVTNIINGKIYIGQTTSKLQTRKARHINDSKNKRTNMYFHRAINKYGKDNFLWEIECECCSRDDINDKERYYINFYKTNNKNYGYNLTQGGEGSFGRVLSKETREKISKSQIGKVISKETILKMKQTKKLNPTIISEERKIEIGKRSKGNTNMLGKHHTEETKRKIGEASKGRIVSDETRMNMSKAFTGRKHSKETKEKISNIKKEQYKENDEYYIKNTEMLKQFAKNNQKKVLCIETGEIFESVSLAGEILGIAKQNIGAVCRGINKTAGGFHFKYMNENGYINYAS